MLSHITGKSKREEATAATTTFDILAWIRARRLKWAGHILRLDEKRLIRHTLRVIYDNPQEGDMLMDVRDSSWEELVKAATDKDVWRQKVQILKQQAQRSTAPPKQPKPQAPPPTACDKHRKTRFVFYQSKQQKQQAEAKLGNANPFAKAKQQLKFVASKGNATYTFVPATTAKATKAKPTKNNSTTTKNKLTATALSNATRVAWARAHYERYHGTTSRFFNSTDDDDDTAPAPPTTPTTSSTTSSETTATFTFSSPTTTKAPLFNFSPGPPQPPSQHPPIQSQPRQA